MSSRKINNFLPKYFAHVIVETEVKSLR